MMYGGARDVADVYPTSDLAQPGLLLMSLVVDEFGVVHQGCVPQRSHVTVQSTTTCCTVHLLLLVASASMRSITFGNKVESC